MEKTERRGGARAGAGRKRINPVARRVSLTVMVDPATRARLAEEAVKKGTSIGRLVDEMTGNLL